MKNVLAIALALFFSMSISADDALKADMSLQTNTPVNPGVLLKTTAGDIVLELDNIAAPETVRNFLQYVDEGFYNNTIFHRVIANFMIQGGGFNPGMVEKETRAPIKNESSNGLKNFRGAIAMARTQNPDSASAQFFINLVDNAYLDGTPVKPGYTVFGKVMQGMAIIDKIGSAETASRGMHQDVPVQDILIIAASRIDSAVAKPTP